MVYGKLKYCKQIMGNIFTICEAEYLGCCYEVLKNTEVVQQKQSKITEKQK
jgi:hypothetical protein